MPAYVDEPRFQRRHGLSGHLIATSLEELHQVADAMGLDRKYFQRDAIVRHYQVPSSRRCAAIAAGAIPLAEAEWKRMVARVADSQRRDDALAARKRPSPKPTPTGAAPPSSAPRTPDAPRTGDLFDPQAAT